MGCVDLGLGCIANLSALWFLRVDLIYGGCINSGCNFNGFVHLKLLLPLYFMIVFCLRCFDRVHVHCELGVWRCLCLPWDSVNLILYFFLLLSEA